MNGFFVMSFAGVAELILAKPRPVLGENGLRVLYEDEWLLVVDKPDGVETKGGYVNSKTKRTPGHVYLADAILYYLQKTAG